jgi:hypothetical protein
LEEVIVQAGRKVLMDADDNIMLKPTDQASTNTLTKYYYGINY